jgi:hypothetical protein
MRRRVKRVGLHNRYSGVASIKWNMMLLSRHVMKSYNSKMPSFKIVDFKSRSSGPS